MKKGVKNLIIGGTVATLLATAGYVLTKDAPEDIVITKPIATPKPTEDIRIDRVIVYNDGSMTFLMDFPEEYGINNDDYIEEKEDQIDYIEIYEEDGTKTIIDYPLNENTETKEVQGKTKVKK